MREQLMEARFQAAWQALSCGKMKKHAVSGL
jgi:hypothetical protein